MQIKAIRILHMPLIFFVFVKFQLIVVVLSRVLVTYEPRIFHWGMGADTEAIYNLRLILKITL